MRQARRPFRRTVFLGLVALVVATSRAEAHAPATAIGRAVEALGQVSVSYDPGSAVSDVEAGNFPQIVGQDVRVAFMPASAMTEIAGGPSAIADEVAREADLDGTLVVLVGSELGAWSRDIGDERLDELVRAAHPNQTAGSPAAAVESLVRSIHAEPIDAGAPWEWIGAALLTFAVGGLVAYDRLVKRRP